MICLSLFFLFAIDTIALLTTSATSMWLSSLFPPVWAPSLLLHLIIFQFLRSITFTTCDAAHTNDERTYLKHARTVTSAHVEQPTLRTATHFQRYLVRQAADQAANSDLELLLHFFWWRWWRIQFLSFASTAHANYFFSVLQPFLQEGFFRVRSVLLEVVHQRFLFAFYSFAILCEVLQISVYTMHNRCAESFDSA